MAHKKSNGEEGKAKVDLKWWQWKRRADRNKPAGRSSRGKAEGKWKSMR